MNEIDYYVKYEWKVGVDLELIPERVVEKNWREVAGFTLDRAKREYIAFRMEVSDLL